MKHSRQGKKDKTDGDDLRRKLFPYKMLSPFFVLTGIFVAVPIILMIAISFSSMGLDLQWEFAGWSNYKRVLADSSIPIITLRTVLFVVICTVLSVLGSIFIALMTTYYLDIAYKRENAGLLFRIIWLIPSLTPSVENVFSGQGWNSAGDMAGKLSHADPDFYLLPELGVRLRYSFRLGYPADSG